MSFSFRQHFYTFVNRFGAIHLCRWLNRHGLMVITYHSVVDVDAQTISGSSLVYRNSVTAEQFETHLKELKRHFRVMHPDQLPDIFAGAEIPQRSLLITFDDGLLNNATVAWPLLKEAGLSALFFLPTDFVDMATEGRLKVQWSEALIAWLVQLSVGNPEKLKTIIHLFSGVEMPTSAESAILALVADLKKMPSEARRTKLDQIDGEIDELLDPMQFPADRENNSILATMTWAHARQMRQEGAVFGAHTVNHTILSRVSPEVAGSEIKDSTKRLAEAMNEPCLYFSYPNGTAQDFSIIHQDMLAEAGCLGAFSQISGVNCQPVQTYTLFRNGISPKLDDDTFCYLVAGCSHLIPSYLRRLS